MKTRREELGTFSIRIWPCCVSDGATFSTLRIPRAIWGIFSLHVSVQACLFLEDPSGLQCESSFFHSNTKDIIMVNGLEQEMAQRGNQPRI